MTLTPGTRLGPYEILAPIGAGGMGEVYRARDTRLDRDVAIKVLPNRLAEDADALARFEREAKAVAALSHPNILAIHDVGRSDGISFAVTELLEGETLRSRLGSGALPSRKAIEYAVQIARGLNAAHEKGIVHRDLKPDNVFVTRDGRVKILDFGLARQAQTPLGSGGTQSPTMLPGTEPGTVMGTVGYMSPEQVRGQPADHRADIFSFGAILFEMISGQRAFAGDSAVETMNAILKEDPKEVSETARSMPPALDRIVRHCLEKNPEERFQSCRDLAFDLESLSSASTTSAVAVGTQRRARAPLRALLAALVVIAAIAAAYLAGRKAAAPPEATGHATFKRITFRRGNLLHARFAPDGQTVVYGAAWDYNPTDVFMARAEASESRSLGFPNTDILSVSSTGDMAILIKKGDRLSPTGTGTLARVPLSGGAPRELLEDVHEADWGPAGEMAVIRLIESQDRLEYPIGQVLYTSRNQLTSARISPQDDAVAVMETDRGSNHSVMLIDRKGGTKTLVSFGGFPGNLAWSPDGREVFFSSQDAVQAVTRDGVVRSLLKGAEVPVIHDVSKDGRLLVETFNSRSVLVWFSPDEQRERDLSWLDQSRVTDLSADGRTLLFADRGGVYLRNTGASSAIRLGNGRPGGLSPDGKWALTVVGDPPGQIVLLPTGPGEVKRIPTEGYVPIAGRFMPGGDGIIWGGSETGKGIRLFVQDLQGGAPRPVSPENTRATSPVSPDGKFILGRIDASAFLFPLAGGEPVPVQGLDRTESVVQWTPDQRSLYVARLNQMPVEIVLFEIATGKRTPWKTLRTHDLTGVIGVNNIVITPDGSSYAYLCSQVVHSDLYIVEGLK
ncbi:MAG TPA: protein kinase [Candidatus Polarisedimenticolia bacterium]|nr:protein kinase [Candidatus Polarisedimenticolia bacterium]